MSDYRREQLLTYVGGPFLVLAGLALLYLMSAGAVCALEVFRPLMAGAMTFVGLFVTVCLEIYGCYVIHEGRRRLASDHWRAEHFVP